MVFYIVTLADAATITVDVRDGDKFRVTLGGNRTLGAPVSPQDGKKFILEVTQDGAGSRTLAYDTVFAFSDSCPEPTLSTAPGALDVLGFIYNSAKGKWLFAGSVTGFS